MLFCFLELSCILGYTPLHCLPSEMYVWRLIPGDVRVLCQQVVVVQIPLLQHWGRIVDTLLWLLSILLMFFSHSGVQPEIVMGSFHNLGASVNVT